MGQDSISKDSPKPPALRQRLDKWLWFARVVKTRTLAGKLVSAGHVRVNGVRIDAPAKSIGGGDIVTIALERQVRVLRLVDTGTQRRPYEEARLLYDDLTPPSATAPDMASPPQGLRDPGSGRPTSKQRRDMARLRTED